MAWLDPLAGTDDARYKSAKEIALENAATALGVDLGEYYPDDWEVPEGVVGQAPPDIPERARAAGDASREEMLVYIARVADGRRRRRRVRRRRVGALMGSAVLVVAGTGFGLGAFSSGGGEEPAPGDSVPWGIDGSPPTRVAGAPTPGSSAWLEVRRPSAAILGSVEVAAEWFCTSVSAAEVGVKERPGGTGCADTNDLGQKLTVDGAYTLFYGPAGGYMTLFGLARVDVKAVEVHRRGEKFDVRLSRPWRPGSGGLGSGTPNVQELRIFMAVSRTHRRRLLPSRISERIMDKRNYDFDIHMSDGRVVDMGGWSAGEWTPPGVATHARDFDL